MLKKTLATAVILLFIGLTVAPSIQAEVRKPKIDALLKDESLLQKILDMKKPNDCGCNDEPTRWSFPCICLLLVPLFILGFGLAIKYGQVTLFMIMYAIGAILNCFWYQNFFP